MRHANAPNGASTPPDIAMQDDDWDLQPQAALSQRRNVRSSQTQVNKQLLKILPISFVLIQEAPHAPISSGASPSTTAVRQDDDWDLKQLAAQPQRSSGPARVVRPAQAQVRGLLSYEIECAKFRKLLALLRILLLDASRRIARRRRTRSVLSCRSAAVISPPASRGSSISASLWRRLWSRARSFALTTTTRRSKTQRSSHRPCRRRS